MYVKRIPAGFKVCIAVVVLLSLLGGWAKPASAATCNWLGGTANWETSSNWSCGHVPAIDDIVIIPDTTIDPVFSNTGVNFRVGEIYIGQDALLTIINNDGGERNFDANAWQIDGRLKFSSSAYYYGVNLNSSVTTGVINVTSTGDINFDVAVGALRFYSPYNNNGVLRQRVGGDCAVLLAKGGTHEGVFTVKNLLIGAPSQNFYFLANSELNIPDLNVTGGNVYIYGSYDGSGTSSGLIIEGGTVEINSPTVTMPYQTAVGTGTTLTINSSLTINVLNLTGTLNNNHALDVVSGMNWSGGGFTGSGYTTVASTATCTLSPLSGGTINHQPLVLDGTCNWSNYSITLSGGAWITNNGTFNATATTTMTGGETEVFTNNGSFVKNTASTTTTMNIPFTNNGTVDIVAGSLVFQQGMENGEDAVINLGGGTLDPGEELILESGDSLVGSGTLASNLVNGGTVSPGASPGIITVDGDYTQTVEGGLEIQLGGTEAGTEYDMLDVSGSAALDGVLNVTLANDFIPQPGDSFIILTYGSGTGAFSAVNLPEGYDWGYDIEPNRVVLFIWSNGSIGGCVVCNSIHTVFVDLYLAFPENLQQTVQISCGETFIFPDLAPERYYVGAWIDLNESGVGPPDDFEPFAWYTGGDPFPIELGSGENFEDANILIDYEEFLIFLPMVLK